MFEAVFGHLVGRSPLTLARDAIDIFLVYYIVYRALLVLRGTRAMQVGVGLGMVFVLYLVARLLELVTLLSIMGAVVSSVLLIIVVVFQNDIRRFLHRVGSNARFGGLARAHETRVIDQVVDAATDLARHRTGAIIAFEQDANLDEFVGVHKGHVVDAAVTKELLVSLFVPEAMNKLHDGAVIIRSLRIAKAGVFFPMPENRVVDESFGSRHRAALGITEETDAVVVVVSEERGSISFCFNGNIASNLDGPKLRTMLEAIFSPKVRKKHRRPEARKVLATPVAAERPSRESIPARPVSELDGARSNRGPESEPPPSRRPRGPGPVSEPPPPLRPRGAEGVEAVHNTGRHSTDLDAWRPPRTPDADSFESRRSRQEGAGDSEPPAPLRSRAKADANEASHITGRQTRLLSPSQATLTPLASGSPASREMSKSSSITMSSVSLSAALSESTPATPEACPPQRTTGEASEPTSTPVNARSAEGDDGRKSDSQSEER